MKQPRDCHGRFVKKTPGENDVDLPGLTEAFKMPDRFEHPSYTVVEHINPAMEEAIKKAEMFGRCLFFLLCVNTVVLIGLVAAIGIMLHK